MARRSWKDIVWETVSRDGRDLLALGDDPVLVGNDPKAAFRAGVAVATADRAARLARMPKPAGL